VGCINFGFNTIQAVLKKISTVIEEIEIEKRIHYKIHHKEK
jgi:hypothetical protein